MNKIENVWAWIIDDDLNDEEGIPATIMPGTNNVMLPLVATKEHLAEKFRPYAQQIADTNKKSVRLIKLGNVEVVDTVKPARKGKSK